MAKIEEGNIESFRPQGVNSNKHSIRGMSALEASMRKHGYVAPITVAASGEAIDGSARLETIANVFDEDVLVVEHDGTRPIIMVRSDIATADTPEARAISLSANRIAEMNLIYDAEVLLADLNAGIDMAGLFDKAELDALLAGLVEDEPVTDPGAQVDKAEELRTKWGVELGQLWQLGKHRLICGDCTDKATVARLMGGELWNAIVTDPPYGVDYEGGHNAKKREKITGDSDATLYSRFLRLWSDCRADKGVVYLWFSDSEIAQVYESVSSANFSVRALIIWNKIDAHYGNFMAQYMQKHEPCIYCINGTTDWHGPTNEVTVWDIKQPSSSDEHPTSKPIECMARPITNSTKKGDIVCDPFLGSGTTLIACEQLSRQCRAVEISPAYVAVALQRWADATGQAPRMSE